MLVREDWFPGGEVPQFFLTQIIFLLCVPAKSLQLCPTLCDPMNCSPPGSSVHGILQARILEWVAMPSSRVYKTEVDSQTQQTKVWLPKGKGEGGIN